MSLKFKTEWQEQAIAARKALDALLEDENDIRVTVNGAPVPLDDEAATELWPILYRIACEVLANAVELDDTA